MSRRWWETWGSMTYWGLVASVLGCYLGPYFAIIPTVFAMYCGIAGALEAPKVPVAAVPPKDQAGDRLTGRGGQEFELGDRVKVGKVGPLARVGVVLSSYSDENGGEDRGVGYRVLFLDDWQEMFWIRSTDIWYLERMTDAGIVEMLVARNRKKRGA